MKPYLTAHGIRAPPISREILLEFLCVKSRFTFFITTTKLEKMMPTFITSPSGQLFNVFSIGSVKALESGFLLLGIGTGSEPPVLDYVPCPLDVSKAWRDVLAAALEAHSHRPNRPMRPIDWLAVAASVDREWAIANEWSDAEVAPIAKPAGTPASGPTRRTTVESKAD
jgi:hypothetical protein